MALDLLRPLSPRRWARIVSTLVAAVRTPDIRHFFEFETAMMDLASPRQLARMAERFKRAPELRPAFVDHYSPSQRPLAEAGACPEGSFGRAYFDFMTRWHLDADYLPPRTLEGELTWFRARQAQAHDQWHAVLGIDADIPGEIEIVAVLLAQFRRAVPREWLIATFTFGLNFIYLLHVLLHSPRDLGRCVRLFSRGYQRGLRVAPLWNQRFEDWWQRPLAEVRARVGA